MVIVGHSFFDNLSRDNDFSHFKKKKKLNEHFISTFVVLVRDGLDVW